MLFKQRSTVLTTMTSVWLTLTLLLPALSLNIVTHTDQAAGKIETDLNMLSDLRALGDGHNANDPAFAALRAELMQQHGVNSVEELPVNIRGIVAQYAEERLTQTLNSYAAEKMAGEMKQANRFAAFGWLSPTLAVSAASRAIAGTDLYHYHEFLRAAEQIRYDFVQGLNRLQTDQLSYADDVKRSSDAKAEQRTRVAAGNWALLDQFHFEPAPLAARIEHASPSLIMLLVWFGMLVGVIAGFGARIKP